MDLDAAGVSYRQDTQMIEATGGVRLARGGQRVEADRIGYNRSTGDIVTRGRTYVEYPGLRILGRDATLNLEQNQGRIDDAHYRFSGAANLRGRAGVMYIDDSQRTRYDNIVYTTCPPGSNAWSLAANKLRLDQESGRGVARDARLRIRGLPVLYTPYINFPIDDRRQSGFLIPSIGSSEDNGFELLTPYYWNIAPNLDATFFPRYMSRRGLMLGGEFRWLTSADRGTLTAEILPDDAKFENDDTRGAFSIQEQGRFFERWATNIDYSMVSDDQYLQDLGSNIEVTSTRRLLQRGALTYLGTGWSLLTSAEAYQNVDEMLAPGSRPYGRLPQLLLTLNRRAFGPGLLAGMDTEYTYFDHNHLVNGQRLALNPGISWPLRRSYGHIIPSLNLNLASYALSDEEPGQPSDPDHAIPTVDLDGRLVFERDIDWLGDASLQTLEPRLYYLYTPYVDQNDTPVFDSSELTFSFSNLFRSNRFTGRDRIGDANQITAALTSRTLRALRRGALSLQPGSDILLCQSACADRRAGRDGSTFAIYWRAVRAAIRELAGPFQLRMGNGAANRPGTASAPNPDARISSSGQQPYAEHGLPCRLYGHRAQPLRGYRPVLPAAAGPTGRGGRALALLRPARRDHGCLCRHRIRKVLLARSHPRSSFQAAAG